MTPDDAPASPSVPPAWLTGTALDEFTPIYMALAPAAQAHGPLSPAEIDAMDIAVVAAMLGIGAGGTTPPTADPAELTRRRMLASRQGETFTWS